MARNSIAAAKTELFGILAPGGTPAVTGVSAAYDHEPKPGDGQGAVFLTVATLGMTPTDYLIAVRVYASVRASAAQAQADLDTIVEAVDQRIHTQSDAFGPSDWAFDYIEEIEAMMAMNTLRVGREDRWSG